MSLRPDHTAADLRALMDQFATAAEPASPAEQANRIRQQLSEMDYGGGRSPHAGMGLPRDDLDLNPTGRKEIMVKPETVKKTRRDVGDQLDQAFAQVYDDKGVAEGLGKDIKRLATGKDAKSRAGQEITKSLDATMKGDYKTSNKHFNRYDKLDKLANKEQGVAENDMYGDEEVSWEKGGRRAPTGAFRNPAVVKTDKSIGTRVSDTGPGGKEYNVKTDKEWDKQKGVSEGRAGVDDTDTVGFSVNSEAAYTAVMRRFGDYIDHDETSGVMSAPARLWPQVEMIAYDADGEGAVRTEDDGIDEGWKSKLAAAGLAGAAALGGYAAGSSNSDSGFSNTKGIDQFNKPTAAQVQPLKTRADLDAYNKTRPPGTSKLLNLPGDFEEDVAEAKSLARRVRVVKTGETGTIRQIKHGAYKGAPKTYYIDLDNGGQADNLPASALRLIKGAVAEVKSKTRPEQSEMDTPAVQGAIARMRQRHEKEPFDLKKAQALGQKLAARNRDPRRK